jgi:hypothetical protein
MRWEVSLAYYGVLFLDGRPSANGTSSQSSDSRLRVGSQKNDLAGFLDLAALVAISALARGESAVWTARRSTRR